MQKTESSSSSQKLNSTCRRQRDLWVHPFILQDLPKRSRHSSCKTFQRHSRYSRHSSHSWHSASPGNTSCSSTSRVSTLLQHSPIRMHILHFNLFPQKLHRVPVETLQTLLQTFILQRKGDVATLVKIHIGRMSRWHLIQNRINPSNRLVIKSCLLKEWHSQVFSSSLSDQQSTEIPIYTYRC